MVADHFFDLVFAYLIIFYFPSRLFGEQVPGIQSYQISYFVLRGLTALSVGVAFMVGLFYKHVVLQDFLDLFHLHSENVSIYLSYIGRGRFGRFKTHARIEFFICKKKNTFVVFDLMLLLVNLAKGSQSG